MLTKEEAWEFAQQQLNRTVKEVFEFKGHDFWHYGKQEIRELLDKIYDDNKRTDDEHSSG